MKLVRPAPGRRVLAPDGSAVPPTFKVNGADPYWARALRCGDLLEADAPAAAALPARSITPSIPNKEATKNG
nr:hypothetical protein [Formicincola oecophyllae]